MSDKPSHEHLAQFLESLNGYSMLPQHERTMLGQAANAIRHLTMFKISHDEWMAKTEWVQKTATPLELGMHRADVLKQRIDALCDIDNVWVVTTDKDEPDMATLRRKNLPGTLHLVSTGEGLVVDLYTDCDEPWIGFGALDDDLRGEED